MLKQVQSSKAPSPLGPYSQGAVMNGFIFISGQIALDPVTKTVVPGGIKEQTSRALENMKAILEEAKTSFLNVTKVTVYLKNGSDFKEMNEVYSSYFSDPKPARTKIVCSFVRDNVLVEMDAIASV
jgi:2-iminobutanoate/2-iminopropanoate deaminase